MNYKIINGTLLLRKNGHAVNGRYTTIEDTLYIKDNKIYRIGEKPDGCDEPDTADFEIIDAKDHLIMPGLINMHTHLYMTVLRNIADDVPFTEWLFERIMPVEESLTYDEAYKSSLLGCVEMLRTGTTSFVDMHMFRGTSARAAKETGLRAFIGRGLVGEDLYEDGYSRFADYLEESKEYLSDRIRFMLAPHAIYTGSGKLYKQIKAESEKLGVLKETHLAESETEFNDAVSKYGKTPVAYLDDLGFLDEKTILAHCVKLTPEDIDILERTGAHVVANPASNAKLGNGFAPVSELCARNINMCLGTDGAASNNTLNMFREMGLLSLMQKGRTGDPTALSAEKIIDMATFNAAKALGMEGLLGIIEAGAYADLIFLNLNSPSMVPGNNIISSLVYSANGSEVDGVMINGKIIMHDNILLDIDETRIIEDAEKIGKAKGLQQ